MSVSDSQAQLQNLLGSFNGQHGIMGSMLIAKSGEVYGSSLPPNIDIGTIGALSGTLFANNDVSIQKMNRGQLHQMTLLTDQVILHFYQIKDFLLMVITSKGQRINLEGLIKLVEERAQQISPLLP